MSAQPGYRRDAGAALTAKGVIARGLGVVIGVGVLTTWGLTQHAALRLGFHPSLGRPWLFRQAAAALAGEPIPPDPTLEEERQLLLHHYDLICRRFGEEKGTVLMRKYACCYAQGRAGAREFRSRVVKVATPADFHGVVERDFPQEPAHLGRGREGFERPLRM